MNISIIGTGYVGLVTGTCFAELGNNVLCVDIDTEKIKKLKSGASPIYEPGLEELIRRNHREGRLNFSESMEEAVSKRTVIFIAVGTPPKANGEANLIYVESVSRDIAKYMKEYCVIVEKSTVPVHTGEWVKNTIALHNTHKIEFDVVSNPEFLREGTAINDFMKPDRIVIGVESERAKKIMMDLYGPLSVPILITDIKSAEIIKHASNSFLAMKISYINAVANLCEKVGADIELVAKGMGLDKRIGRKFLNAGIGYGGSCFPKDADAFIQIAEEAGYDFKFMKVTQGVNKIQRELFFRKIKKALWNLSHKQIAVLGLAFKPNTDDLREAPAIPLIQSLQDEGAKIKAFDPAAMEKAKGVFKGVEFCNNLYDACKGSDALVIVTEWNEFRELDLNRIKELLKVPLIIDGRNIYDPVRMKEMGFRYISIGRKEV